MLVDGYEVVADFALQEAVSGMTIAKYFTGDAMIAHGLDICAMMQMNTLFYVNYMDKYGPGAYTLYAQSEDGAYHNQIKYLGSYTRVLIVKDYTYKYKEGSLRRVEDFTLGFEQRLKEDKLNSKL